MVALFRPSCKSLCLSVQDRPTKLIPSQINADEIHEETFQRRDAKTESRFQVFKKEAVGRICPIACIGIG
jgi:hypothetical protein